MKDVLLLPNRPKPSVYKVSIRIPEKWKVESIAKYKHHKLLMKSNLTTTTAAAVAARTDNKTGEVSSTRSSSSIYATSVLVARDDGVPKESEKHVVSTSTATKPINVLSDNNSRQVNDKIIKSHIAMDHIKKELDILHSNSIVIKNKMVALNSVRNSLLWLLKKSNAVERSLIS